ncbi:hypothetical protein HPP92_024621 [Vanilla planifolia]|uniref:Cytochrome b561 and DOMON domain-containing protein n=1 Tax=Vanilla planifolia TaxID=51239 RepID=A0A835PL60_VANPL|nr:hypothetical protein HPP92_024621 [Vanilla planifolia]
MAAASLPREVLLLVVLTVAGRISLVGGQADSCVADINTVLPVAYGNSTLACRPIWNNLVLRYAQDQKNVLTIVLSMLYTTGWVGMGFSKDGMMVGSSAMVGWIGNTGRPHVKQFYLSGQSSSKVLVDQGQLPVVSETAMVFQHGPNIYLAFQLKFASSIGQQMLLFAFGTATPVKNRLKEHQDKISVSFDFSAGTLSASSYPYQLKRTHGILNIFGWGVLLPIGAIVARYFRRYDPMWFYLHAAIQFIGFILGLAGVVAGIALYHKLHASVSTHRALGILILVLGILQVLALFLRPDKDHKLRKYWNWYHWWIGRLLLFVAAVNIFVGIHVGYAGDSWKIGYAVYLVVLFLAAVILEIMLWNRGSKGVPNPSAL